MDQTSLTRPHVRHSEPELTPADLRSSRILLRRLQRVVDLAEGYSAFDLCGRYERDGTVLVASYLRPFTRKLELTESDEQIFASLLDIWVRATNRERLGVTRCNGPNSGWTSLEHDMLRLRHARFRGSISPPRSFLGDDTPLMQNAPDPHPKRHLTSLKLSR